MSDAASGTESADLARGRLLADLGRWPEAVEVIARAAVAEDTGQAWCELARAQLEAGQPEDALASAGRAVALDPTEEWPHRVASAALQQLGRPDEAVRAAEQAVRLAPYAWPTHAAYAVAACRVPRLRMLAWQAAGEAARLAPDEPQAHTAARVVAMECDWREAAEQACRRVLALDPTDVDARHDLAALALLEGRLGDAASGFTGVAADDPGGSARVGLEITLWRVLRFCGLGLFLAGAAVDVLLPRDGSVPVWLRVGALLGVVGAVAFVAWSTRGTPPAAWAFARRALLPRPLMLLGVAAVLVALVALAVAALAPAAQVLAAVRVARAAAIVGLFVAWRGRVVAQRRPG